MNGVSLLIACALGFAVGLSSVHFNHFPYSQLRQIKQALIPSESVDISPSYYYHNRVDIFRQQKQTNADLIFAGDSLTDDAEWQELFPSLKVINRGIQGDTTSGLLKRLDTLEGDSKLFLMIGINDLLQGREVHQVIKDYEKIIRALADSANRKPRHIFIQSCLLVGSRLASINDQVEQLNQYLQQLAETLESVTYIDLNAQLSPNSFLKSEFTIDDLHLNGKGYQMWRDTIAPYVENN